MGGDRGGARRTAEQRSRGEEGEGRPQIAGDSRGERADARDGKEKGKLVTAAPRVRVPCPQAPGYVPIKADGRKLT